VGGRVHFPVGKREGGSSCVLKSPACYDGQFSHTSLPGSSRGGQGSPWQTHGIRSVSKRQGVAGSKEKIDDGGRKWAPNGAGFKTGEKKDQDWGTRKKWSQSGVKKRAIHVL